MTYLLLTILSLCLPPCVIGRTFITYAALGDSYATGNGAGAPLVSGCGRFAGAYPVQASQQLVLALRNLACAGAFMSSVIETQLPWVDDSDVVSVQVGGNEANFFALLNECIQQWWPVSSCQYEITKTQRIIESSWYIERYNNLVAEIQHRLQPDTVLLVLGYTQFFNADTDQCDHVSFSRTDPDNVLTIKKRQSFNELITKLNSVIRGAAELHGAVYVDVDKVFEGHRFCEEGVVEPSSSASWFFNDNDYSLADTLAPQTHQAVLDDQVNGIFDLVRTFHPTVQGHTAIANEIVQMLRSM